MRAQAQFTITAVMDMDSVDIGGRNYLSYSKGNSNKGYFKSNFIVSEEYAEVTISSKKQYSNVNIASGFLVGIRDYEVGTKYIYSYEIMFTKWDFPVGATRSEWWMGQRYTSAPTGETATGIWKTVTAHTLPAVGQNGIELNKWYRIENIITIPEQASANVGSEAVIRLYNSNIDVTASVTLRLRKVKLEKGNKATDWTPAPEDIEASIADETDRSTKVETTLSNEIKQTADSLTSEISSRKVTEFEIKGLLCSENLICSEDLICSDGLIDIKTEEVRTEVKQTFNSYGVQIDNLSENMSAQFMMLEASIALKVSKDNLIGEINLSAEEAKIKFSKISLEGYTTINNYFKVLLDGSIEATNAKFSGKISASTITGTEISGTNITGGTINGATITSSGTGNTTKIQSGYIETTRIDLNVGGSYANSLLTNAGLTVNYGSSYANYSTEISITNGSYSTYISATGGTIAGSQILTAGNYTNSGRTFPPSSHNHLSTDITPLTTGPGNIDFAGSINGASVTWVQDNFQAKSSSDMRLKRDIKSLDNIVNFYMNLKPKSYKFKGDLDDGNYHYGLLAQEVLSNGASNGIDVTGIVQAYDTRGYLDEGIYTGDKAYRVNYEELHGLHISMIQNIEKRLRELEDRIA